MISTRRICLRRPVEMAIGSVVIMGGGIQGRAFVVSISP